MYFQGNYRIQFAGGANHLAHYGISGQQWGKRRYQNEDGTLTEEGKRRYGIIDSNGRLAPSNKVKADYQTRQLMDSTYSDQLRKEKEKGKPVSPKRQKWIDEYKQKGLTQEQAEAAALRKEQVTNVMKVAGAVALTAAVAYGAYKGHQWLTKNADKTIKAGTDLYRTTGSSANELKARPGYVALNPKDADKYAGRYGQQVKNKKFMDRAVRALNGEDVSNYDTQPYQVKGKAAAKIRVAGDRKANKVYQDLLKNDKQFAADNEVVRKRWEDLGTGNNSNSYKDFNTRLVDHEIPENQRVQDKFYDALKKKGYGGVIDVNDRDYSGYHAKNPTILFNLKESITGQTVRQIGDQELMSKFRSAGELMNKQAIRDANVKNAMDYVRNYGILGAVLFGGGASAKSYRDKKDTKSGAYYKSVVKQYRKEHPNTKLSDADILKNELGAPANNQRRKEY